MNTLDRRMFMKLAGAGIVGTAIGNALSNEILGGQKYYEFPESVKPYVEMAKREFGLSVRMPDSLELNGKSYKSKEWQPEPIAHVLSSLKELPLFYKKSRNFPELLSLYRIDGTSGTGLGGGYFRGEVLLYTAEDFDMNDPLVDSNSQHFYGSWGSKLTAVLGHEITHAIEEGNPQILNEFITQTGWHFSEESKKWINNDAETLIREANVDIYPNEDLAMCVALIMIGKGDLLSPTRRRYFLNSDLYGSWTAERL